MTETQFAEVQRYRDNVFDMINWLDLQIAAEKASSNKLIYFMTHPLMSTQNRPYGRDGSLRVEHLEQMLVVCNTFEVQNGARTRALNGLTGEMVAAVDRQTLERLANTYDLAPKGPTPWLKGLVGGSDDHAGINPGRTWTEFACDTALPTPNGLVDELRARRTRPGGAHGGPITLAHALLKLLYDGGEKRRKEGSDTAIGLAGPTRSLLRVVFDTQQESDVDRLLLRARLWIEARIAALTPNRPRTFEQMLHAEMNGLITDASFRARLGSTEGTDDRIFLVIGTLLNRMFSSYLGHFQRSARGNVVDAIKALVAMVASNVFVSLPYFVSFLQQSSDSLIARDVRKAFKLASPRKLVLVTDTFFEVNGVSGTIRRMIAEAERRGVDLTVVTCVAADDPRLAADPTVANLVKRGRLKVFHAVTSLAFPEYDELKIQFPPLLEVLRYLQEGGFTKMQISTPGTVGLTGLLAAKLLQIETSSTYHTSFPEYVENYTRDLSLEALAWNYMILFYHAVDEVVVPSKYIARLLHKRGLRNRKLLILDRWVDLERFHPKRRDTAFWLRYGPAEDVTRFIYVGRLGVEKNLELVASAFRALHAAHPSVRLVLVGDGPYRGELENQLAGLPVTFTGYLAGDDLAVALASADVKLFPSTTDTWGNAPLEAQASGVPVIVSNIGGPCELMEDGVTGVVVSGRDVEGLTYAMELLLDPGRRGQMAWEARAFTERHAVPQPFTAILDADAYRASLTTGAHPSRAVMVLPAGEDHEWGSVA
jgi:glycosyltransferase involved in cell wall biosynthesis